jgi:tetratricopeptide (TPR) repeat protein
MRPSFILWICFFLFFFCGRPNLFAVPGNKHISRPQVEGQTWAVIMGVSDYKNLNKLYYAHLDAQAFYDFMVYGQKSDPSHIKLLIDSNATKSNFFNQLTAIKGLLQPKDRVFIYFAGHGDVEVSNNDGYLLAYNCAPNNYGASDAISIMMLEDYVDSIIEKKANVVLITDACRSGVALAGNEAGRKNTISALKDYFKHSIKIMSCEIDEVSNESPYPKAEYGHGIFSRYLLSGLSGLADTITDAITVGKLMDYIKQGVTTKYPQQNPVSQGDLKAVLFGVDAGLKNAVLNISPDSVNRFELAIARFKPPVQSSARITPINPLVLKFNDELKNHQIIDPVGDNAFETIQAEMKEMRSRHKKGDLSSMKIRFINAVEEEETQWINEYLKGAQYIVSHTKAETCSSIAKKLGCVLKLIDKSDLRFKEIYARQLFFKGYTIRLNNKVDQYAEALCYLKQADSILPQMAFLNNALGIFEMDGPVKNLVVAQNHFLRAISLAPTWAYPYFNLGILYAKNQQDTAAENSYFKALLLDPRFGLPYYALGNLAQKNKLDDKAEFLFKKSIEVDSTNADALANYGNFCRRKRRLADAEKYYRKALNIDPLNPQILLGFGNLCFDKKAFDTAVYYYELAAQSDSGNVNIFNNIGICYEHLKNLDSAIVAYKHSIEVAPLDIRANIALATIYQNQKAFAKSEYYYGQVLKQEPNNDRAKNGLRQIHNKKDGKTYENSGKN